MKKILEGIVEIDNSFYLKENKIKKVIYYILSVITFFLTALIMKLNPNLKKYLYDEVKQIEDADFIFIIFMDTKVEILKLTKNQKNIYSGEKNENLIFLTFQNIIYFYSKEKKCFLIYNSKFLEFLNKNSENLKKILKPLKKEEYEKNFEFWGENNFGVKKKSLFRHILDEFLNPFYFFFFTLQAIFIFTEEYGFTLLILMDLLFIFVIQRKNYVNKIDKINSFTKNEVFCNVLRRKKDEKDDFITLKKKIESKNLTQGDILEIKLDQVFNFDCLILSGECLIDQSSLTGEIIPIFKNEFVPSLQIKKKNIIFSGSKLIEKKTSKILVLVLSTGFNTFQGKMISNLVEKKTKNLTIEKDFIKIFTVIFLISFSFITYKFISDYNNNITINYKDVLYRYTQLLKDSFPITCWSTIYLTNLVSFYNLQKKDIQKIRSDHISLAGRMKVISFDKTGTLTEESMKLYGYLKIEKENLVMKKIKEKFEILEECKDIRFFDILACCHNLFMVKKEVFGDPMEKEMLSLGGFGIEEIEGKKEKEEEIILDNIFDFDKKDFRLNQKIIPGENFIKKFGLEKDFRYEILKVFHFNHEKKMMSVIIRDCLEKERFLFLTKGAPEVIKNICKTDTIPLDYNEKIDNLEKKAFRVISTAYKEIYIEDFKNLNNSQNLDNLQILENLDLKDLEKDLIYNSSLIYENSVKKGVKESISSLKKCGYKVNMITGDSLTNAISVGYKIGMLEKNKGIFIIDYNEAKKEIIIKQSLYNKYYHEKHQDSENNNILTEINVSLKNFKEDSEFSLESLISQCNKKKIKIAINGKSLDFLLKKYNDNFLKLKSIFNQIKIFARAKPDHKRKIVRIQKEIQKKKNFTVAFVGDGANDAEALNEADIGFSIANEFTSIVAGYYTKSEEIEKIHTISIEGKFGLSILKEIIFFLVFYTVMKIFCIIFMAFLNFNFGFYDYFLRTFFYYSIVIGAAFIESSDRKSLFFSDFSFLNKKNIFFFLAVIFSLFLNTFICFYSMISDERYKRIDDIIEYEDKILNHKFFFIEGRVIIFFCCYMVPLLVISIFNSFPFKKNLFSNRYFYFLCFLSCLFFALLFFSEIIGFSYNLEKFLIYILNLPNMDFEFKIRIFLLNLVLIFFILFVNKNLLLINTIKESKEAHRKFLKRLNIKGDLEDLEKSENFVLNN